MENSKKKIINKLKEATVDKAAMQRKWDEKLNAATDVVSKSLPDESPEDVADIAAKLATESIDIEEKQPSQVDEVNSEVMNKFINKYGEKRGKQIYYATANKENRNEKTFKVSESGDVISNRSIESGVQEPEVGADKYDEYRMLMKQLASEEGDEQPVKEGPTSGAVPAQTNDPVKLRTDVAKLMSKLDISAIAPYLVKIDNPTEQAEVIAQFAEKIGVPKNKLSLVINQLRTVAENGKVTKEQLKEAIIGVDGPKMTKKALIQAVSGRKIIKTIKVKDIK